jgi:DNA ligase (NAD+)
MENIIQELQEYTLAKFIKKLSEKNFEQLHSIKLCCDDYYYNTGENMISDEKYDILKNIIIKKNPNYIPEIGAKLRNEQEKINLPYYLGSATFYTPKMEKQLNKWIEKNHSQEQSAPREEYIISDKLDGVSCLYTCNNGNINLYTRGNGHIGTNISYLSQYIKNIPKTKKNISVRGELIIPKHIYNLKYSKDYKNSRNMVSGLISSKTMKDGLHDIHFIVYEIISDETMIKPSKQLEKLNLLNFNVVKYSIVNKLNLNILKSLHKQYKNDSLFQIDGIIIQTNIPYDRYIDNDPEYLFAFKMLNEDNIRDVIVKNIIWKVSKYGSYKPVVIIDPIELQGVTIQKLTGHHAKNIIDKKIGIGSLIRITRSNDVIPYILDVIKESDNLILPTNYKWDETKTNIYITEENKNNINEHNEMKIKLISQFFEKLNIKFISLATVTKLYNHGLTSIKLIISTTKNTLLQIPTIEEKSATRIITNIKNGLNNITIGEILGASSIFGNGIGRKRLITLFNNIPDIFELYKSLTKSILIDKIILIDGFSKLMANKIYKHLNSAQYFLNDISIYVSYKHHTIQDTNGNIIEKNLLLLGKKFVMSGFRDKILENYIFNNAGNMTSSISKNTTALIINNTHRNPDGNISTITTKITKANSLKIPIYTKDEFISKYNINI